MSNEQQNGQTSRFNPKEHLTQIKSRNSTSDYLPVQWRLVWYRNECPNGTIETQIVHLDLDKEVTAEAFVWNSEKRKSEKIQKVACGIAVFKATITDGNGASATGYGSESAADFGDFLEKAETKAIGRALAALGYGTQFTGDELNEAHRIVDSPVESPVSNGHGQTPDAETGQSQEDERATDQQISAIQKMCELRKRRLPDNLNTMNYTQAAQLLRQLSANSQSKAQAS